MSGRNGGKASGVILNPLSSFAAVRISLLHLQRWLRWFPKLLCFVDMFQQSEKYICCFLVHYTRREEAIAS
jgi:hypothetical protein